MMKFFTIRSLKSHLSKVNSIPFQTEPYTTRYPEARNFDPFHSGFNPEADPIIPTSEEYPLRGEISPPSPRRSIVESSDSSSDDEKFRHKPWITENILGKRKSQESLPNGKNRNDCCPGSTVPENENESLCRNFPDIQKGA